CDGTTARTTTSLPSRRSSSRIPSSAPARAARAVPRTRTSRSPLTPITCRSPAAPVTRTDRAPVASIAPTRGAEWLPFECARPRVTNSAVAAKANFRMGARSRG
ncbi:MAG: hypothetical protein AVDCRST_MAG40-835, partial [uncultured Gemmatimonadaceae bacterium]